MLITRWNEASRALPVLALKPNYLDRWPNDCTRCFYLDIAIVMVILWEACACRMMKNNKRIATYSSEQQRSR